MSVVVGGRTWAFVGGPIVGLRLAREFASLLGPVGMAALQAAMTGGTVAVLARLAQIMEAGGEAAVEAERVAALQALGPDATPDAMRKAIESVTQRVGVDLLAEWERVAGSDAFVSWVLRAVEHVTVDGSPVDPKDPDIPAHVLLEALYGLGAEQGGFKWPAGTGAATGQSG